MSEDLGRAVLDLGADLLPLDRDLEAAKRRCMVAVAEMQTILDRGNVEIGRRIGVIGRAYDRELTPPLTRFGGAVERMARQVDGSLAQMRVEQAAVGAETDSAAARAEAAAQVQVAAAQRVARAYLEEAAAAKEAAAARRDAAMSLPVRASAPVDLYGARAFREERRSYAQGDAPVVWGVRGPRAAGSIGNPVVTVLEAASRTGLGSMGAAIGESSQSGGARTVTVAEGGGGRETHSTTVVAGGSRRGGGGGGGHTQIIPLPWWMGGGRRGGGGGGGLLSRMLLGGGGFVAGTAALGSLGGYAGLGAEHILTTLAGLAGSAAGGAAGGGLLALGAGGQLAVGGGSDLAVMKSTITQTKELQKAYDKVVKAVQEYGAGSRQAKEAQIELNTTMAEMGNTAGVKAEFGLAKASESLTEFWDKQTSTARVRAVEILTQVLQLGRGYVPLVAQAAQENLGIINRQIKPLFGFLGGTSGKTIFHQLEDEFRARLPTAIHAGTQGLEFFLRLTAVASTYTSGFMSSIDRLATRLNALSNPQVSDWVGRMVADFRMWWQLIKLAGEDIYLLFKNDVGTAKAIVEGITHALEKAKQWELSTKGSAQIQSIFMVHKEQIVALGHAIEPLFGTFTHLYMAMAPASAAALTTLIKDVLTPMVQVLADIAKMGEGAAVGMALLFASIKAFGAAATWTGVKTAFGWLLGSTATDAAEANAAAAANARLAASLGGVATAGGAAAAGETAAGAAGAAGLPGILGRLGGGATTAVEGGALGLGALLERFGLGGAAEGVVGAGGALAPILGTALPALAAGGAGFLGGNFLSNLLGLHGGGKGALEGVAGGAATGAVVGSVVPVLGTGIGALLGGAIGGVGGAIAGASTGQGTIEISNLAGAARLGTAEFNSLVKAIERVKNVKVSGVAEPWKEVVAALHRARASVLEWNHAFDTTWRQINRFALGSGPLMKEAADRFATNMREIAYRWGLETSQGRKFAEENVQQMVEHMVRGVHEGKVPMGGAMAEITKVISAYTSQTGDETPRVYQRMFNTIDTMFKRHEVGTKTVFAAYTTIAAKETGTLAHEVESRQEAMFSRVRTLGHEGLLTAQQQGEKEAQIRRDTGKLVSESMENVAQSIVAAMESGTLSSSQGLKIIHNDLNQLLGQFGAKKLSMPQVEVYTAGAAIGGAIKKALKFAGGGHYQIGRPGEAGHDTVPLSVGGQEIVVGGGEIVSVFNRHQIPYIERGLEMQGFDGLGGFFGQVNRPNYMASGGVLGNMVSAANAINARHYPYVWGGGHSGFAGPYDCSGAVSAVLHAGGYLSHPEVSGELMNFGAAGPGAVTVYANPHHTFMSLMGRFFGTHGSEGAGWYTGSALPGYAIRHVPGLTGSSIGAVPTPGVRGSGAMAAITKGVLAKAATAANAYLAHHAMAQAVPGVSQAHGVFGKPQLEALWKVANPDLAHVAHLMAAIALAESSGDPQNIGIQTTGGRAMGLWQIMMPANNAYVHGNVFEPLVNARAAGAILRAQGLGAWETYTNQSYRKFMGLGGIVKALARGGMFALGTPRVPRVRAAKISKPKGVQHVRKPAKAKPANLKHLVTSLEGIPGMGHAARAVKVAEQAYGVNVSEQELLGGMTGNAASILPGDMQYLAPTLMAGENILPGMSVPAAEREYQRALQTHGESEGLSLQSSLLGWIGGLDDHRLVSAPDVGVLARTFGQGVPFMAGSGVFADELMLMQHGEMPRLGTLIHVLGTQSRVADRFIQRRERRKRRLEALARIALARHERLKRHLEAMKTAALRKRLSHYQAEQHRRELVQDARAHDQSIAAALEAERGLPRQERSEALINHLEQERRSIASFVSHMQPTGAHAVSSAREALERNLVQKQMTPIEDTLRTLTGSTTKIGKGGEVGELEKQLKALRSSKHEIDVKLEEAQGSTRPQLELSIAQLQAQLAEAQQSIAPAKIPGSGGGEKSQSESELAALLKQQNEQLSLALAVSQRQYKVLANVPPFAGHFAQGGTVPGPLGAPRTAIVHGGEKIKAVGDDAATHIHFENGMEWLRQFVRVEQRQGNRVVARRAGRRLPSNGGGLTV